MSVTYTDTEYRPADDTVSEAYVPVYARKRAARGRAGGRGFKTWMILAPLGVLVVGGTAAAMMMNGSESEVATAPVAETAPAVAQAPLTDMMAAPAAEDAAALTALRPSAPVEAAAAPAPVTVAAAPARRATPVQRRAVPAAPAASVATSDAQADDRATATLNAEQADRTQAPASPASSSAATETSTPRTPDIVVQPLRL